MARQSKRRRKPATRKKSAHRRKMSARALRWHIGWCWLSGTLVLGVLLSGGYLLYLSQQVRLAFEGKRWTVPARVYARPLELYEGAPVSVAQLRYELTVLGYRKVRHPSKGAEWSQARGRFLIHTRPFVFWDGEQPARRLMVRIASGRVIGLSDVVGRPLDLVRLEPAEIGSIYPAHKEDRILVRREDLPEHLVQALLAVEDRRFFGHHGVDLRGIARALWANLRAGRAVQGGSTLTQQLVKNFFLTSERRLWRKLNEALMALIVEKYYSKDEILEAYANEIFLGQDGDRAIHGFGLAARFYFNRPLTELQVHETALLAGLVKGASYYNPRRHPERARKRRNLVLDQMHALGFLDERALRTYRRKPLGVTAHGQGPQHRYPAFIQLVRRQLVRDYREEDLTSEGLHIFTTLGPWVQKVAAEAVAKGLRRIEKTRHLSAGSLQAAMVMVTPDQGEVRVLIGGRRANYAGFNRALDAHRPIGSLVKPALYLAALSEPQRYTLATLVGDSPLRIELPNGDIWTPDNFDHQAHGRVPLHRVLAQSYNLAAVHVGMDIGVQRVVDTLHALGMEREVPPYPSVLLGALPLAPIEVAQIYQTIAASGFRAPLRAIREVLDTDGRPLQRYPLVVRRTVDPVATFLVSEALQEVVREGTARSLRRWLGESLVVAGKTGTTDDLRDSWFAGFGADRVAVVWVGRDDNRPTGLTGSRGALPLFGRAMRSLHLQALDTLPPTGVEYHWIEDDSGMLSAEGCKGAIRLPFATGSQPHLRSACGERGGQGMPDWLLER